MLYCITILGLLINNTYALELKIKEEIPEKFILYNAVVGNNEALDKKVISKEFKQKCKESKVKQCKLAIYNTDKILVAFGEERTNKNVKTVPLEIVEDSLKIKEYTSYLESLLAYETTPKEIYQMYDDNEVVADEDLRGKNLLLADVIIKEVAKDAFNQPYISVSVDKHGYNSVIIKLNSKDPFLRKVKKGSKVYVLATPERFVIHNVQMKGKIFMFDKYILINGMAVDVK